MSSGRRHLLENRRPGEGVSGLRIMLTFRRRGLSIDSYFFLMLTNGTLGPNDLVSFGDDEVEAMGKEADYDDSDRITIVTGRTWLFLLILNFLL